jgi:predicted nucleotidyltransferase
MDVSSDLQMAITAKIRESLPEANAIIFFGSRVRGLPEPTSDYDVMVMTPTGVDPEDRDRVKGILQATFPDITLDLVFGSERYLLANLAIEPFYRFWLENGIALYGQIPHVENYPRLYRGALDSRLDIVRAEVGVVDVASRTLYQKGRGYLRILKQLMLIENALHGDYRNDSLWAGVEQTTGNPTFQILRDSSQRHRIRQPMVTRLRGVVLRKLSSLRKENMRSRWTTSKYPKRTVQGVES